MIRSPVLRSRVVNDFVRTDIPRVIQHLKQRSSELIMANRLNLVHESLTSITHFNGPVANRNIVPTKGDMTYIICDGLGIMCDVDSICERILVNNQTISESPYVRSILGRTVLDTTIESLRRIRETIANKGAYGHQGQRKTVKRKFVPQHVRNMVASSQGWKCNCCRETFGTVWHNDHIVPLAEGGEDSVENFQALCVECHTNKTARENQRRAYPDISNHIIIPRRIVVM